MFHPFALAVCKGEAAEDFAYIFRAVQMFCDEWAPDVLLADASDAITNGFINVFGVPRVRLMCYFHVVQKLEKYLKPLECKKRVAVKEDIRALQTAQDRQTFTTAADLFLKKWRSAHPDLVSYIQSQWLNKHREWYEGAAYGYPSTNNGLEATNAWIKKQHTFGERYPVGQFLNNIIELITKWSKNRDPQCINCIHFILEPAIPLQLWTTAYHWALESRTVLQRSLPDGSIEYFTASSTMKTPLTTKLLRKFNAVRGKWSSFEEYRKYNYGVWVVATNPRRCSCPYFLKYMNCKHSLGMQIREKEVLVPPEARSVPLGQKRKRGRPSKAKRALLTQ